VLATTRSERATRREQLSEARRVLRELVEQEAGVDAVMAQTDAVGALETESRKAKLRTMLELRSLLGPEQWNELKGSFHRHRHGERMEKS
jgi:Spy/CpxP family protein refolding chaperone